MNNKAEKSVSVTRMFVISFGLSHENPFIHFLLTERKKENKRHCMIQVKRNQYEILILIHLSFILLSRRMFKNSREIYVLHVFFYSLLSSLSAENSNTTPARFSLLVSTGKLYEDVLLLFRAQLSLSLFRALPLTNSKWCVHVSSLTA